MIQIAKGKRQNGLWQVWVRIEGQWYSAIDTDLSRAFLLAAGTHLGPPVSRIVN
jgi:hypothetical protein